MKTAPFYKLAPNRVWRTYLGGRNLDAIEGKAAPEDSHFPEDWILSTTLASNVGRESIREGISSVLLQTGETVPLPRLLDAFQNEGLRVFGVQPPLDTPPERVPDEVAKNILLYHRTEGVRAAFIRNDLLTAKVMMKLQAQGLRIPGKRPASPIWI